MTFNFKNSYARLPERFFERVSPTPVASPSLVRGNDALALELGLDPCALSTPEGISVLAGNTIAPSSTPLAMAYAGHQFGTFVPQLGDGRAVLLGELNGFDLHLKGAGRTRFSRRGDGRAALGPVLREFIISEAMAALGVPTTRSLAAIATGEDVFRETPLPGAILARIASSHVRVGTFEYFAARRDVDGVRVLADYVISRTHPRCKLAANPYRALLDSVIAVQAELVAKWMLVGFIHGVMNTDNMTVSGETIDFGPCAFMDFYKPDQVYSSIDSFGRYAYANQPAIAHWNLACLAQTLVPLLAETEEAGLSEAEEALSVFAPRFQTAYLTCLTRKVGLDSTEEDIALAQQLLYLMAANGADFTLTFRRLADIDDVAEESAVRALFEAPTVLDAWLPAWRKRRRIDGKAMRAVNPAYIPRNHLVEEALAAATRHADFGPFNRLVEIVSRPFDEAPGGEIFALPPRPEQVVKQTFCGT